MAVKGGLNPNYPRTSTGVVGISVVRTKKHHRCAVRSYFSVHCRLPNGRASNRTFCIETLGRGEAWRQALKCRAECERRKRSTPNVQPST
jgi:hypothetical protein